MTTQQIITLARTKLLEVQDEIVKDDTLLIYANLAYQDIIKRSFVNNAIISEDINFVNGEADLPVLFGTLYSDAMDASGNVFSEVSISDFPRYGGNNAITISGGKILVSPSSTSTLRINYYPT